jgi:hypothetical protein
LEATQDPNVPNNNTGTGIILSIIPVLIILVIIIIYYSSSIENTASMSEVGDSLLRCEMLSGKNCEDQR